MREIERLLLQSLPRSLYEIDSVLVRTQGQMQEFRMGGSYRK